MKWKPMPKGGYEIASKAIHGWITETNINYLGCWMLFCPRLGIEERLKAKTVEQAKESARAYLERFANTILKVVAKSAKEPRNGND